MKFIINQFNYRFAKLLKPIIPLQPPVDFNLFGTVPYPPNFPKVEFEISEEKIVNYLIDLLKGNNARDGLSVFQLLCAIPIMPTSAAEPRRTILEQLSNKALRDLYQYDADNNEGQLFEVLMGIPSIHIGDNQYLVMTRLKNIAEGKKDLIDFSLRAQENDIRPEDFVATHTLKKRPPAAPLTAMAAAAPMPAAPAPHLQNPNLLAAAAAAPAPASLSRVPPYAAAQSAAPSSGSSLIKFTLSRHQQSSFLALETMFNKMQIIVDVQGLPLQAGITKPVYIEEQPLINYLVNLLTDQTALKDHKRNQAIQLLRIEPARPSALSTRDGSRDDKSVIEQLSDGSLQTLFKTANGKGLFDLFINTGFNYSALQIRLKKIYDQLSPIPVATSSMAVKAGPAAATVQASIPSQAAVAPPYAAPTMAPPVNLPPLASTQSSFFAPSAMATPTAPPHASHHKERFLIKSPEVFVPGRGATPRVTTPHKVIEAIINSWTPRESADHFAAFLQQKGSGVIETVGPGIQMGIVNDSACHDNTGPCPTLVFYDQAQALSFSIRWIKDQLQVKTKPPSSVCFFTLDQISPYINAAWHKIPAVMFLEFYITMQALTLNHVIGPKSDYTMFGDPAKRYRFGRNMAGNFCFDNDPRRVEFLPPDARMLILNKMEKQNGQYKQIEKTDPEYLTLLEDMSTELIMEAQQHQRAASTGNSQKCIVS